MNPTILAKKILRNRCLCNHCLGRQFGQLLTGTSNKERGKSIRNVLALEYESKPFVINKNNFYEHKFRTIKIKMKKEKCVVCEGLFDDLGKIADRVIKKLEKYDYNTFVIGSRLDHLIENEEKLWSKIGVEFCESIRAGFNRDLGKKIWEKTGKEGTDNAPNVTVLVDVDDNKISARINSVYFYGEYKKLVRGLPQTKWERYKETVEDIIAKPFMKSTEGTAHSLHAAGREDIDAKCLAWRPFVLEIEKPVRRDVDFKAMTAAIKKTTKVSVNNMRLSDRREVVKVKSLRHDKTYRALVELEYPVKDIKSLKKLIGVIKQETPLRVKHRRADKTRNRKVKSIEWKKINNKKLELKIKGEAGLYIKELVSGDNGRTKPSVSQILKTKAKVKELDVILIE
ncbi:MAG: tRNA pseudouridine(54/55) synthase Pus10 [Candidatus Aenigmatarchaeota archaeon]